MSARPRVCVIGGGVIGIGTALNLMQRVPQCQLKVCADIFSPLTTGDGSAGLWGPYLSTISEEKVISWSRSTWKLFAKWFIANDDSIDLVPVVEITSDEQLPVAYWKDIAYKYSRMTQKELNYFGKDYIHGNKYLAYTAEPAKFLPKLSRQISDLGGEFQQRRFSTVEEAAEDCDIVINCTGIGAHDLVPDPCVYPIRGQLLRVKAPWVKLVIHDESIETFSYIIPNSDSCILGGTHQDNDWRTTPDEDDKQKIWNRCVNLMPSLKNAEFVSDFVGLRPARKGGVRIEKDEVQVGSRKVPVVHNYGHGGSGVTTFWGCAQEAVDIVCDVIDRRFAPISRL